MPSASAPADTAATLDVSALSTAIAGAVLTPGDAAFEAASGTWNLHYAATPAVVVSVATEDDVAEALRFARANGLEIAVRSGGHSLAGFSTGDGVLVIDLRALRGLDVDPETAIVAVGTGLTAGELTAALVPHGLAIPFGDTGSVGVAGLTLGGGIGYLARKHGLAIDRLRSVDLVTVDGDRITASAEQHPDLFWALRGGGGNFGIVTRFVFEAVRLTETLSGALVLPLRADVLRGVLTVAATAPDELTTIVEVMPAPPAPFIPEALVGTPVVFVLLVWAGDPATGEPFVDWLRALAEPIADLVAPMPYGGIYVFSAEVEHPMPALTRSLFTDRPLDEGTIDRVVERMTAPDRPDMLVTQIRVLGGEMGRVAPAATAFAHRDAQAMVSLYAIFTDPASVDAVKRFADAYVAELAPIARGAYVNFLDREGPDRLRDAYPEGTYRRLAEVKAAWDPENVLRRNQNILPAMAR